MTDSEAIITRHRHEVKRRMLTVREVTSLTPHMLRILLEGDNLADFVSLGFDDHIKLLFPGSDDKPTMREYTPRAFDTTAGTLTLDFALHEAGPATAWAAGAKPGDRLEIAGPRGSAVIRPDFAWWLLIGDETALPAIARKLEELPADAQAITLGVVPEAADQQDFASAARLDTHWVLRPESAADDARPVLNAVQGLTLPEGRGFVWIAAEAKVARALRDHFQQERGHPRQWIKAAGYWTRGIADGADKALE
ncbi:siderophore-interacting protein [Paracoccus sp. (in: a-proteobacteria)]|uniref:siderophore-interacting protein n=1 Tax=Paracoccus sp. TaxID=267 RepID=UPI0028AD9DA8|nr:siderophore-interacting protein [Paracoccus sp. (in: a-proteobacteria)]